MLNILIVEDEGLVAADIESSLQPLGNTTRIASSGELALQLVGQTRFDLALMDIRLPGKLDGIETALILKRRFRIGVIFLTAHADQETLTRAQQAQPFGYLLKPFREQDLRVSIELFTHYLGDQSVRPESQEKMMLELLGQMKRRKSDVEGAIRAMERVNAPLGETGLPVAVKRGRPTGSKKRAAFLT